MLTVAEPMRQARATSGGATVVVAIPALNEEDSIAQVVAGSPRALASRVIVADGGSSDATAARAAAAGATVGKKGGKKTTPPPPTPAAGAQVIAAGKGYGRACWQATQAATDADIMVFMDGDGADDPASLAALVQPIVAGDYDFVIGSRARGERAPGSIAWHQLAAGALAGFAMRMLYGVRYTDMCAFRAIRRQLLLDLGMREMGYGWNIEMQMRAARSGLRILEIPVAYHCRTGGSSKVAGSLRGSLRAGARILATFCRVAAAPRSSDAAPLQEDADA
jgi:glycosyltransferase involved in cell wall biosynthesis